MNILENFIIPSDCFNRVVKLCDRSIAIVDCSIIVYHVIVQFADFLIVKALQLL